MGSGLRAYRHTLEVLVESSALYSISLILYIALDAQNSPVFSYFDSLAAFARVCIIFLFLSLHSHHFFCRELLQPSSLDVLQQAMLVLMIPGKEV